MPNPNIYLYKEDNVNAASSHSEDSIAIPKGQFVNLKLFGARDPNIGDGVDSVVSLQWGDDKNGWETIRSVSGTTLEFEINRTLRGDGSKKFRINRINKSNTAKSIAGWLEVIFL